MEEERINDQTQNQGSAAFGRAIIAIIKSIKNFFLKSTEEEPVTPLVMENPTVIHCSIEDTQNKLQSVGSDCDPVDNEEKGKSEAADEINVPVPEAETNLSADKLADYTVNLIFELDRRGSEAEEQTKYVYEDLSYKLIENLILSGCRPINPQEGEIFESEYHMTVPFSFPPDKSQIQATTRLGIMLGERVLLKAIVELKETNHEILQPSTQES